MVCKKCKKEIPDNSLYCNHCEKKQITVQRKTRTHKRPHGQGTIYFDKRSSRYIAWSPSSPIGTGRTYIGAYKTYAAASEALDEYLRGVRPDLYNATFSQIYNFWSAQHFSDLSDSTVAGYRAAYKIAVNLHGIKFRELKTADFQRIIDNVSNDSSRSKCAKIQQLFSQLCKYAMQNDVIDKNYASFVRIKKEDKKKKVIFTNDELKLLWQHSNDERIQIILFMCYSGFTTVKNFKQHFQKRF
ncbi:MAG: hypothetical protein LUE12_09860 [Ruminococcus sp.]|nr:hypothetical protein [Ruminococcus sp.]